MLFHKREGLKISAVRWSLAIFVVVSLSVGLCLADTAKSWPQRLDALKKIRGEFSFVVLGDTRSGGDDYTDIIKRAMTYGPEFVINTGDMVGSAKKSTWIDFWRLSSPITVPYFLTVGNHDVNDGKSEELYKEEVDLPGNELYYSFVAGNSLFVFLDSNQPGREKKITGDQYQWLRKVLSASREEHKFVFVHHPLYPDKGKGHHYGGSLDKYPDKRDRLEALFEKEGVDVVFVGHEHFYSRKAVNGVVHIITGGGGARLYTSDDEGGFYHFILVNVEGKRVIGKVIDINGQVRDTFQLG